MYYTRNVPLYIANFHNYLKTNSIILLRYIVHQKQNEYAWTCDIYNYLIIKDIILYSETSKLKLLHAGHRLSICILYKYVRRRTKRIGAVDEDSIEPSAALARRENSGNASSGRQERRGCTEHVVTIMTSSRIIILHAHNNIILLYTRNNNKKKKIWIYDTSSDNDVAAKTVFPAGRRGGSNIWCTTSTAKE